MDRIHILPLSRGPRVSYRCPMLARGSGRWLAAGEVLASCRQLIIMLPQLLGVGKMIARDPVTVMTSVCKVCIPLKGLHLFIFLNRNLIINMSFFFVLADPSGCFTAHAVSTPSAST